MKKIRFNIIGAYGEHNFGDDLLMMVFEKFIYENFSDVEINFIGCDCIYPYKLLTKSTYNQNIKADWLIYGGGTQFFSFPENRKILLLHKIKNAILNPKKICNKLGRIILKKHSCKPEKTAFLGFGIGPFHKNINVKKSVKLLNDSNFIGVRDEKSYQFCKIYKIPANLGADVVFSSYFDDFISKIRINKKDNTIDNIGIVVRDWPYTNGGEEYIENIIKFCNYYKLNTTFIIFSPEKDKGWINIINEKRHACLVWDPNNITIENFLNQLNLFDCIISARYHGAIIGVLLNKPTICINLEPKIEILSKQINSLLLWNKPFDISELYSLLTSIPRKDLNYSQPITERRRLADHMLIEFIKEVNNNN